MANPLYCRSFISIQDLSPEAIDLILERARTMEHDVRCRRSIVRVPDRIMIRAFYEASTHTTISFGVAMLRLGGQVIGLDGGIKSSSVAKGETFEDAIETLSCMGDILAVRDKTVESARVASTVSRVPVVNSGNGVGEHPTQALLDLYTIRERLPNADYLVVTMVGDLKHGRTVHSLTQLLGLMYGKRVMLNLVSPQALKMPTEIKRRARAMRMSLKEHDALTNHLVRETDVLYVTRVQKERFTDIREYEALVDSYVVTMPLIHRCKKSLVIMHPFPRVYEIDRAIDKTPFAAYFTQIENGVYVRMAILDLILRPSA